MNVWIGAVILILLGLSMVFKTRDWLRWLEGLERQGRGGSITVGSACLLLGGYILAVPDLWYGPAVILALLGIAIFLKGAIYLALPGMLPSTLAHMHENLPAMIRVAGFAICALGVGLFVVWIDMIPEGAHLSLIPQAQ